MITARSIGLENSLWKDLQKLSEKKKRSLSRTISDLLLKNEEVQKIQKKALK